MAAAAEAVALLEQLRGQVAAVSEHARGLLRRVRAGGLRTEKGLPVLGLRPQELLRYLQDLALLLAAKAGGRSLRGLPPLPRLLETRLVLEKLRPLEQRLKYQVEKLLRAAMTGGRGADDPLSFRPAPANMAAQEEEEEEEDEGGGGAKAPGLGGGRRYVPPRLVPVQYEEAGRGAERRRAWARRRALSSAVLRELREELGDGPRLEGAGPQEGGGAWAGPAHRQRLRTQLEESMLIRLRREGRGREGAGPRGGGALASITHFRDIGPLLEPPNQEAPPPKKRKKPKLVKRKRRGFRRRR